ncbi:hypothetical protein HJG60_011196 [Phyllostomus discolor]|uniref:Uncharacterized protein n=1 Tax=Phyllostomus discolor TaxID=89673 RepID=A0A833ZX51_9CHIR|nr:hypothetical protein HJG60_011196 [Phyllostomus discolor]
MAVFISSRNKKCKEWINLHFHLILSVKLWPSHLLLLLPHDIILLSETFLEAGHISLASQISGCCTWKKQDCNQQTCPPISPESGVQGLSHSPWPLSPASSLGFLAQGWPATLPTLGRRVPKRGTLTSQLGSHTSLTLRHTFFPTVNISGNRMCPPIPDGLELYEYLAVVFLS